MNISSISNTYFTNTTHPLAFNTYWWRVRGNNSEGYGSYSIIFNFTVVKSVAIALTTNTTDFGTLARGSSNSTLGGSPSPLVVENQGNTEVNLTINATALWSSVSHNTSYFMAMANISGSEANSFDTSNSVMSWFNLSTEQKGFVAWLNWTDTKDTAAIEINITAPLDEPPATKVSDIVIVGSET